VGENLRSSEEKVAWHELDTTRVVSLLGTSAERGLSLEEASSRLHTYGHNRIHEEKPTHPFFLFLNQFRDFMIYFLLVAALVSGLVLRELLDVAVILFIVALIGILGFIQEYRAEKALESLRVLGAPTARVIREGLERVIPSHKLVPGDIILLEAGDRIPADARVLESHGLRAEEASLTGESDSVEKRPETLRGEDLPLGDQVNMVFTGTHIVHGRGTAVVVETGKSTQLGRIAEMLGEAEEEKTPLQKELAKTGKRIAVLCLGVCVVVFILGGLRGQEWSELFLFSVSLAVAAIPEGLLAIVTIALALGVRRMADRNALLRRLPAVETLGCADVICTDKTGTLTRNQIEAQEIHLPDLPPFIPAEAESGRGEEMPALQALLAASVLCNDAREQEGEFLGEGTEVGLLRMARGLGFSREEAEGLLPRVEEIPFESERKMMSTVHAHAGADGNPYSLPSYGAPYILLSKGAPEAILHRCDRVVTPDGLRELTGEARERLEKAAEDMAGRSLRTLAFACRPLEEIPRDVPLEGLEGDLAFLGMVGMIDPPRPEVFEALDRCRRAGIRVVMITGDHAATARAIARELDILTPGKEVVTGAELARMDEDDLAERVEDIAAFARVSPADKVKIVRAWKSHDKTVAMTGDGVNDAPALKNADIGVAMGITGTDVSKEASDMVLSDDNFATIVNAVEEGRVIYDNLKKFVYFLLSCNISEVITMFIGMIVTSVIPLRPVQILWMNLVTDGFPALALGVDTPAPDIMSRPPRDPSERMLSWEKQVFVVLQGAILSLGGLAAFFISLYVMFPSHIAMAQTVTFVTLVFSELLHSFNSRSETITLSETSVTDNRALLAALAASAGLQVLVVTVPPVMRLFGTEYIGAAGWGLALACSLLPVALIDRLKFLRRR